MSRIHLIACPGCARHVRVSEAICPFCKGDIGEALRASTPRQAPAQRLSRAALYAFGVGSITIATACGGDVSVVHPPYGTAPVPDADLPDGFNAQPLYGASFDAAMAPIDAGTPDDGGVEPDVTILPPYGISPPFDAGEGPDADLIDGSTDANNPADVGVAVPYGVPGVIFHDK
jgi:hypothetical protein